MDERLKKVLVVYSTLSGCTTTIAKRIGVDLIAYDARPLVASVEEMPNIDVDVDAVVFGSFYAVNASDIRIWGRGTIDGSQLKRGSGSGLGFSNCNNIKIEGIVLRDPAMWCCALFGCTDVEIDNVKIVGQWRYNSDGIDVVNSSRVRVRNCFVRSFDDALVSRA